MYADIRAVPHIHTVCVVIALAVDRLDLGTRIAEVDAAERHVLIREPRCRTQSGGDEQNA